MSEANVPAPAGQITPTAPFSRFPGMRWHPVTGEMQIFQVEEDMPEGWLDYHPENPPVREIPEAKEKPAELCMTREEIATALAEGGVSFKKNASVQKLYDLLMANLKSALTEQGVVFTDDADAKALMDLFPKE
jgi:hypothetical protein